MAARALTKAVDVANDDEITIERRVKVPDPESEEFFARETTKMGKVDARLLSIARGELEPEEPIDLLVIDDPFGGLIPVFEDAQEVLDDWLLDEADLEPFAIPENRIPYDAVPRLCMAPSELVALPLDHRSGFLLSHIDGQRTVEEVIDVSHLSPHDTLDVMAALVALGAIAID
jgi:hypothetical protein